MHADDLEFYHDIGGAMRGKEKFDGAVSKNICGNPANKVRREAIAGTVQIFPMMADGELYGTVIEGNHRFFIATPKAGASLGAGSLYQSFINQKWRMEIGARHELRTRPVALRRQARGSDSGGAFT